MRAAPRDAPPRPPISHNAARRVCPLRATTLRAVARVSCLVRDWPIICWFAGLQFPHMSDQQDPPRDDDPSASGGGSHSEYDPSDLGVVPLFPLPNVVLFPRAVLPLHVFEERYKEMTARALRTDRRIA